MSRRSVFTSVTRSALPVSSGLGSTLKTAAGGQCPIAMTHWELWILAISTAMTIITVPVARALTLLIRLITKLTAGHDLAGAARTFFISFSHRKSWDSSVTRCHFLLYAPPPHSPQP